MTVNHYPWELNHPAKNANELGPAWQNIAVKSDIHEQKENDLEYSDPGGTLKKLNNLKPLISSILAWGKSHVLLTELPFFYTM